jgi:hypothetical protein
MFLRFFRAIGSDIPEFNFNNNDILNFDLDFNFNATPMDDAPLVEDNQLELAGTPRPKQIAQKASNSSQVPSF